jgi:hypothetical protein
MEREARAHLAAGAERSLRMFGRGGAPPGGPRGRDGFGRPPLEPAHRLDLDEGGRGCAAAPSPAEDER